jgi:hypothetical protein
MSPTGATSGTLTDRCVEVLDVSAAGLMLVSPGGDLRVMASSRDAMRVLELFELPAESTLAGPDSPLERSKPGSAPCTPSPCTCGT